MKNKMSILLIVALILTSVPGFSVAQGNIFTVDKAINLTIEQNVDFKTNEIDKIKLGRQIDSLKNNVNSVMMIGGMNFNDQIDQTDPLIDSIQSLENSVLSMTDGQELQKEILKGTIKNLYITTNKMELQIEQLENQIETNEKELRIVRKRLGLGLVSTNELERKNNEYNKVKRQCESLKIALKKIHVNLNDLMGIDTSTEIVLDYGFLNNYQIVPMSKSYTADELESLSIKVKTYRNASERAKNLKVNIKSRYPVGSDQGKDADYEIMKADLNLKEALDSMMYKYESALNTVADQLSAVKQKEADYNIILSESKTVRIKLKLGSASQNEYDTIMTQQENARIELQLAKLDYYSSRVLLEAAIKGIN